VAVAAVAVLVAGVTLALARDTAAPATSSISPASLSPARVSTSSGTASMRAAGRAGKTPRAAAAGGSGIDGVTSTPLDPSFFAQGACVAFTPHGGGTRGETVFIDAGHGGIDPGGTGQTENGTQVYESQVNLPIEMDAMRVLTGEGYRVVVSRTEQTTVLKLGPGDTDGGVLSVTGARADIAARDICANMGHANLLAGIYMDAGYGGAGSVTLYDTARPFAADNERFANLLQHDVLAGLNAKGYQIPDDGVSDDTGYGETLSAAGAAYGHLMLLGPAQAGYFTTPSQMPGALIEPLFLTDPFEASIAASGSGQRLIADEIADAAGQYFAAWSPAGTSSVTQPEIESAGHDYVARGHLADG
jgi:N-acetylmuramoyl-L-alanine amidase